MWTSSRNVVLDLFKNINKTLEIIHLETIITHLYQAVFPLVCTSAINQTLKIPVIWAVLKEELLSSLWQSSISHHTAALGAAYG